MRIALVTNNYTPYSGGVVSSIQSFHEGLMQAGHEVFIITLDFGVKTDDQIGVIRMPSLMYGKYKKNHVAIPFLPTHHLFECLRKVNPDIIHTQHPFLLGQSALKAAKKLDLPILFTYHTAYEKYAHYIPAPQLAVRPVIVSLVNAFCQAVDGIVAPSHSVKNELQERGIHTPISVIPSGIAPMYVASTWQKPALSNRICKLLTVSRFMPEKNIHFLLDMVAGLNEKKFSLTLIGYGHQFEELQAYAYERLKLSAHQIQFIYKPQKQYIAQAYRDADLFVFSSTTETQGLVIAEAMASGTPVVALAGPGQNDVVMNGKNGYLVSTQEEMRKKINELANHPQLFEGLCRGAWETGREFSHEQMTKRLIDKYQLLLLR